MPDRLTYAWCFDHGTLHRFLVGDTPWCTAAWVAFTATTEQAALDAKHAAWGEARFLHDLSVTQQLEVIEIGEARQ